MRIENHRLVGAWREASPHHGGVLRDPTLLVMHSTASGGEGPEGDADYFLRPEAKASAHVVVGRNGHLAQVVPFNRQAWHAGVSIWRGLRNCNDYSIGIEIDNWGKLVRSADGRLRTATGQLADAGKAVLLTHKHEGRPAFWEVYSETQLAALVRLARAILQAYPSIQEIVGHDDIAPARKLDPGPAFPMPRLRSLTEGRGDDPTRRRKVMATRLNARGGPGLEYEVLGTFLQGHEVEVLYDSPGPWAQVMGATSDGAKVTAWVADQYLR